MNIEKFESLVLTRNFDELNEGDVKELGFNPSRATYDRFREIILITRMQTVSTQSDVETLSKTKSRVLEHFRSRRPKRRGILRRMKDFSSLRVHAYKAAAVILLVGCLTFFMTKKPSTVQSSSVVQTIRTDTVYVTEAVSDEAENTMDMQANPEKARVSSNMKRDVASTNDHRIATLHGENEGPLFPQEGMILPDPAIVKDQMLAGKSVAEQQELLSLAEALALQEN